MAKYGHMLGFKGTFEEWEIDVYVKEENGGYKFLEASNYVNYHEHIPIKYEEYETDEVDGDQYGYGLIKTYGVSVEGVNYNGAKILGTMKDKAMYRVIYITDRELRGVKLVRIKGKGLDRLRATVEKLEVEYVEEYVGDKKNKVFMTQKGKDELIQEVYNEILDVSAVMGTLVEMYG